MMKMVNGVLEIKVYRDLLYTFEKLTTVAMVVTSKYQTIRALEIMEESVHLTNDVLSVIDDKFPGKREDFKEYVCHRFDRIIWSARQVEDTIVENKSNELKIIINNL